jgi:hypothetical protein
MTIDQIGPLVVTHGGLPLILKAAAHVANQGKFMVDFVFPVARSIFLAE